MTMAAELQADILEAGADALGIRLSEGQIRQFRLYYAELARWNERVNLTSVSDWEGVQSVHFVDSLSAAQALTSDMLQSGSFIDVGSGAGFPGIPMKLAFPGMHGALLDSTAKKTAFLTHIHDALSLRDIAVCTGRAETLAHDGAMREMFDIAFARAVAETATLAELTLPFVRVGGIVALHKKADIADELKRARNAIDTLGGALVAVLPIDLPRLDDRALVVLEKRRHTPERYPRRPGMPAKRPLK